MYIKLILIVLAIIFPIYWMVTISLKTSRDIYRSPSVWPTTLTGDNFQILIQKKQFFVNIRNGLIVATGATVTSVFIAALAAYSLVRLKYRFRGVIGRFILLAYLTPASLLFIPLSVIVARLNLGNSLHGLVIVYLSFSCPFSTWLLMGYFRGIPADLEEQAMVDGTTRMGAHGTNCCSPSSSSPRRISVPYPWVCNTSSRATRSSGGLSWQVQCSPPCR